MKYRVALYKSALKNNFVISCSIMFAYGGVFFYEKSASKRVYVFGGNRVIVL